MNLAVARDCRRRGLGRFLLRSLLDHVAPSDVKTAFLEVREGNQEARGLYESFGFQETQRRRGFYREPVEDAVERRGVPALVLAAQRVRTEAEVLLDGQLREHLPALWHMTHAPSHALLR